MSLSRSLSSSLLDSIENCLGMVRDRVLDQFGNGSALTREWFRIHWGIGFGSVRNRFDIGLETNRRDWFWIKLGSVRVRFEFALG